MVTSVVDDAAHVVVTEGEQIAASATTPERLISSVAAAPAVIAKIAPVDAAREVVQGVAQSRLLAIASTPAAGATTLLDTVANVAVPLVATGEQDVSDVLGGPLEERGGTDRHATGGQRRIASAGEQAVSAVLGGSLPAMLEPGEQQQPISPSLPALTSQPPPPPRELVDSAEATSSSERAPGATPGAQPPPG